MGRARRKMAVPLLHRRERCAHSRPARQRPPGNRTRVRQFPKKPAGTFWKPTAAPRPLPSHPDLSALAAGKRAACPARSRANFYAASRLCFLQQALIQFCNLFFAGIPRIAGEVNRRRRFTGRIPRSLRDFVFAGRKTGILSPMAFLAYSKLLYSWAISSSLVSRGLPGQQASA